MKNYYFLANALPVLELDSKPVISFAQLMTFYEENLTAADWEQVKEVRRYYDILNIERLLEEQGDMDARGNLSENDLREALLNQTSLPPYVFDFFEQVTEKGKQLQEFSSLVTRFFTLQAKGKGVAAAFFRFERELRLHLMIWRVARAGKSWEHEARFEESGDDLVARVVQEKEGEGGAFQKLKAEIDAAGGDPKKEERAVEAFRFEFYQAFGEGDPFSLPFLLSFLMRLIILENLDVQTSGRGELILNSIVKDSA